MIRVKYKTFSVVLVVILVFLSGNDYKKIVFS